MYAIIGVTGQVGQAIASHLQNMNIPFKAIVRSAARVEELEKKGIAAVVAELHDAEALTNAFKGVESVFVMTPPLFTTENPFEDHDIMLKALIQAVEVAKPLKVVYLSSVGAHLEHGTGAIRKLYDMEKAFKKLNVPTVAIRAAWFMENFILSIDAIRESGNLMSFITPASKAIPMVSVKDIGLLVTELLQEDWTGHKTIELAGPCTYSPDNVAAVLGYLLDRSVTAVPLAEDGYESAYLSFGFTAKAAAIMAEMNMGFNKDHIVFERGDNRYAEGKTLLGDCLKSYIN